MKYSKYIIILFAFFLSAIAVQGKEIVIKGRLKDFDTGEPVYDVFISSTFSKTTYSNREGYFELKIDSIEVADSVFASDMRFYTLALTGLNLSDSFDFGTLYLHERKVEWLHCNHRSRRNPIHKLIYKRREKRVTKSHAIDAERMRVKSKLLFYTNNSQEFKVLFVEDYPWNYMLIDLSKPIN
jgi:hypothetical protein